MSLCDDLLTQARHLALLDLRRPKQANLRRALSSAYYGLFHLLVGEASTRMTPRAPAQLASYVARSLSHTEMRDICRSIAASSLSAALKELQPGQFSLPLRNVARTFVDLQDARHMADYDLSAVLDRATTITSINNVENAFDDWHEVRNSEEANVFLAALLFGRRWNR